MLARSTPCATSYHTNHNLNTLTYCKAHRCTRHTAPPIACSCTESVAMENAAGSASNGDTAGHDVRTFASDKFNAVQDLLDTNKFLIAEINNNHDERSPESLARNVLLIKAFNDNINRPPAVSMVQLEGSVQQSVLGLLQLPDEVLQLVIAHLVQQPARSTILQTAQPSGNMGYAVRLMLTCRGVWEAISALDPMWRTQAAALGWVQVRPGQPLPEGPPLPPHLDQVAVAGSTADGQVFVVCTDNCNMSPAAEHSQGALRGERACQSWMAAKGEEGCRQMDTWAAHTHGERASLSPHEGSSEACWHATTHPLPGSQAHQQHDGHGQVSSCGVATGSWCAYYMHRMQLRRQVRQWIQRYTSFLRTVQDRLQAGASLDELTAAGTVLSEVGHPGLPWQIWELYRYRNGQSPGNIQASFLYGARLLMLHEVVHMQRLLWHGAMDMDVRCMPLNQGAAQREVGVGMLTMQQGLGSMVLGGIQRPLATWQAAGELALQGTMQGRQDSQPISCVTQKPWASSGQEEAGYCRAAGLLPLTTEMRGGKQYMLAANGNIMLRSGFNCIKVADSFVQLLQRELR